jgi:hypothetical protein
MKLNALIEEEVVRILYSGLITVLPCFWMMELITRVSCALFWWFGVGYRQTDL